MGLFSVLEGLTLLFLSLDLLFIYFILFQPRHLRNEGSPREEGIIKSCFPKVRQDTMQTQRGYATEVSLKKAPDQPYMHEAGQDTEGEKPKEENWMHFFAPFLKVFPSQRKKIERYIRCLQEAADKIEKTHKDCTIASLTAGSTSIASGILSILGLTLTPLTAGGSLILTATGIGLGAAAGITGVSAGMSEEIINSKEWKKAQELIKKCEEGLGLLTSQMDCNSGLQSNHNDFEEIMQYFVSVCKGSSGLFSKLIRARKEIGVNVKALKCVKGNPALKDLAKQAAAAGSNARASIKGIGKVEQAFQGTALAMSKGARVTGAALAGAFLLVDAYFIVKDAMHLAKGAEVKTASEIRKKASEFEKRLDDLNKLYEGLNEIL